MPQRGSISVQGQRREIRCGHRRGRAGARAGYVSWPGGVPQQPVLSNVAMLGSFCSRIYCTSFKQTGAAMLACSVLPSGGGAAVSASLQAGALVAGVCGCAGVHSSIQRVQRRANCRLTCARPVVGLEMRPEAMPARLAACSTARTA